MHGKILYLQLITLSDCPIHRVNGQTPSLGLSTSLRSGLPIVRHERSLHGQGGLQRSLRKTGPGRGEEVRCRL